MFQQVFDERKALVGKWVRFSLYLLLENHFSTLLKVLEINAFV